MEHKLLRFDDYFEFNEFNVYFMYTVPYVDKFTSARAQL